MNKIKFNSQELFVWELLLIYFSYRDFNGVIKLASSMYEQNFTFFDNVEILLMELWEKQEISTVYKIAEEALSQNLFDIDKHFYIVSKLIDNKAIDIEKAMCLLDINVPDDYSKLNKKIKHIIDVLWLLKEDSKDTVMSAGDDDMLKNALSGIKDMY